MREVAEFPRRVREIENVFIPLADGRRLAARLWLPEDAESDPVPAVIEYMPYRKRDHFRPRDSRIHHYIAGHGYACLRVDVRGSGESDGLLRGEWEPGELDDGIEMIEWAASQRWSTGAVRHDRQVVEWIHLLHARRTRALGRSGPSCPCAAATTATTSRCTGPAGAFLVEQLWWTDTMVLFNVPSAGPGHRGRGLARDVAGTPRRQRAVDRHLARPPASRRLLAPRLDL